MRKAKVYQQGVLAGILEEVTPTHYRFTYRRDYDGHAVSLTMPVRSAPHEFNRFPPPFEGLLPEGRHLESLLRQFKLDAHDYLGQLLLVGGDVVGSLTFEEAI